ncbi:MAG: preprotein translocase subunit SecY [Flavobacteriales bacterium]|jgi:preprotein translocase subunit SecY|nr:preprotein translocase subunit SecY [Flavobacteriales bacterium]
MNKLVETLKNIWKIEELKSRILITLGFLLIYRFGSAVVLPGIDPEGLQAFSDKASSGLPGILNMFTGGAFAKASILALGIMPYISASIVVQLLGMAVPYMQKLQRDGESGRNKLNQITRYLTIAICLVQAPAFLQILPKEAFIEFDSSFMNVFVPALRTLILITGTMFAMWLGERITDKGIGNGISILIMVGIIAAMPVAMVMEYVERTTGHNGGILVYFIEIVILLIVIAFTILIIQGVRKIPVQVAKRVVGGVNPIGGVRQYLPLKVTAAGVMPIIFAQAIVFLPSVTVQAFTDGEPNAFVTAMSNPQGFWYNFVFAVLIIVFTFFYTAMTVNTNRMAEDLKRTGGFVPGVKPGKDTADYLDKILTRIVFPGSLFLALIAILPAFVMKADVNPQFAQFFGGTSLLIIVGVILDTLQQIESYLLARHYDGMMKTGRIQGRTSTGGSAI